MTLHEREEASLLHTYKRLPIVVSHGQGVYLYDTNGKSYLDFLGGVAVNALGYGHDGILQAITQQASRYIHVSNYFVQEPQVELAERLRKITGYERVFFCNSGAEAIEGALKLIRKWGNNNNRQTIISMQDSFHGRTMGALSVMSNVDYRDGFGPYLDGCLSIPFNNINALEAHVNENTVAVMLECIQGEGGINEVKPEFVQRLQELREQFGFLLAVDEVQSGLGRTGRFLASEHFGLAPDIVTLAKPLGGGLPLGAILVNDKLKDVLQPGNHGTTFGGNPVACAAGNVVLRELLGSGLLENAARVGSYLIEKLKALQAELPDCIREVRGKGLMVGVELVFPGKQVVDALLEKGIILNCTHTNVLRFVPPLIVEPAHIDVVYANLRLVLQAIQPASEISR
ncbi:MAG: aspartate aminotransferase family protein [Ignavibacteriae bacterium]|nr:aspartate aminotransferase family protein [Ignavibacteriota bacterium]